MFVPRSEITEASGYIAEVEDFHPLSTETEVYDRRLSALASNAYRISSELTFIIDNMGMNLDPPAINKAFGGIRYDRTQMEVWNWEDYVTKLEGRSSPIIASLGSLIRERRNLEKKRDDLVSFQRALGTLARYSINLAALETMKRFHAEFVIVESKDVDELTNSIPECSVIGTQLTEKESAVLVIGAKDQSDRLSKTLRSFDARAVSIPKDLPQNPHLASEEIAKRLNDVQVSIEQNHVRTAKEVKSINESILGLREAADVAYRVLEELKKSGRLKRVSIIQGYVPTHLLNKLESRINGRWPLIKNEIDPHQSYAEGLHEAETGATEIDQPPTRFNSNNKLVVAHQPVTLTSGPPVYGEFDPTPLIAITFPIFYGIMFGDVGHGLLLMLVGGLIYLRGTPDFKNWGILLLMAGISATVMGLIVGEVFGFELPLNFTAMIGIPWLEHLKEAVGPLNPNGLAFNISTVLFFIKLTIYIGILHIYIGLAVGVYNKIRTSDYWHMLASLLPTISGYTFFLIFGFAFKDANFNLAAVTNGSNLQANIGLAGLIVSIIWLFVSGPVLAKSGKIHGSVIAEVGAATMEFLEWVVSKFVGNTVSYVRLSILLVVHAALLSATNLLFFSYGYVSAPILVVLNLLIFAFEGLIVYVQSLRLHLYEFFSKFYVGTGTEFNSISPKRKHVEIKWLGERRES